MEPEELEFRLQKLKEEFQSGLDAVKHGQRMFAMATGRQFEGDLAQLRQDLSTITSRMAPLAELQELRQSLKSLAQTARAGAGGQDLLELLPLMLSELARLREEAQTRAGVGPSVQASEWTARLDALESESARRRQEIRVLAERSGDQQLRELESRLKAETVERTRELEALQGEVRSALDSFRTAIPAAVNELRRQFPQVRAAAPEPGVSLPAGQLEARLEVEASQRSRELQTLREDLESGMEALRAALPAAVGELRRQLPQVRDCSSDVDRLSRRLAELEDTLAAGGSVGPGTPADLVPTVPLELVTRLEELTQRLQALESSSSIPLQAGDLVPLLRRLDTLEARDLQAAVPSAPDIPPAPAGPAAPVQVVAALDPEFMQDLERRLQSLEARGADPSGFSLLVRRLEALESRVDLAPLVQRLDNLEKQAQASPLVRRLDALEQNLDLAPLVRRMDLLEQCVDFAPLLQRLEALERRAENFENQAESSPWARRLEALEERVDASPLAPRVEALEAGWGAERQRVREFLQEVLEDHDLLLRRLESRLSQLVQDFHRLGEELAKSQVRTS